MIRKPGFNSPTQYPYRRREGAHPGDSGCVDKRKAANLATRESEARSNAAKIRAEANFKREERAKDGAKAMMEYQANSRLVREKMARLKALRLAKETADKAAREG